ncbi:MAG: Rod shape-determining protein MreB [Parcubacteria group bacterium ADurb.Bin192]|nr:MAG: Rod shape-determining protein MreB [Parcubacteria group bacterium ADurb.Bin192]
MFQALRGRFSTDLGIDLGTSTTYIYAKGRGIVVNEPSVVAVNLRNGQVLSIGHEAKTMLGKTPAHVQMSKPIQRGIISDFEVAEKMLRYFFNKITRDNSLFVPRPRVVVGVPLDVTEVERKAVGDVVMSAGAKDFFLVENPLASAIGNGLPISEPIGNLIVDMGSGNTEIAVISLNGIVTAKSIPIAGDEMNRNIIQYARDVFNLLLGERVAEEVKIAVGSAIPLQDRLEVSMRGRDLLSGLPREIMVNDTQIREALARSVRTIVEHIKSILEITPPELVADIYRRGLILTGGGALLRGMDQSISAGTGLPVRVAEDPGSAVARGAGTLLDSPILLKDIALPKTDRIF